MRPGGGKQKGAAFERQICKALSLWVSDGEAEDLFWRSAMSGGRATVFARKGGGTLARQAGDITATAVEGHALTDRWFLECKFIADLRWGTFLTKGIGPLADFWAEANAQAKMHKRFPMLIARENSNDTFMLVPMNRGAQTDFPPSCRVATLHTLGVDVFGFDAVLKYPFIGDRASYDPPEPFRMKPGELARILGYPPQWRDSAPLPRKSTRPLSVGYDAGIKAAHAATVKKRTAKNKTTKRKSTRK